MDNSPYNDDWNWTSDFRSWGLTCFVRSVHSQIIRDIAFWKLKIWRLLIISIQDVFGFCQRHLYVDVYHLMNIKMRCIVELGEESCQIT
jgi:hypothetical protein